MPDSKLIVSLPIPISRGGEDIMEGGDIVSIFKEGYIIQLEAVWKRFTKQIPEMRGCPVTNSIKCEIFI